jgi:UDP-N-acetylglucosamine--N-acetylmuramyl-(pentapeptide) pyrophosphoryl-undecaprenol N-acetylglucosamine transferase
MRRIWLVGGGTAGHISPLRALNSGLRGHLESADELILLTDRGQISREIVDDSQWAQVFRISSGKFRRYHGRPWAERILDLKTPLLNIKDVFFVLAGAIASAWLLVRYRPDVIFLKGGAVSVPVGLAAVLLRVPYITHDSDTVPGLANRIVSRWAQTVTLGNESARDYYQHRKAEVIVTGNPLRPEFYSAANYSIAEAKTALNLPVAQRLVLVVGGSTGSEAINEIVTPVLSEFLLHDETSTVLHVAGKGNVDRVQERVPSAVKNRYQVIDYLHQDVATWYRAADVVVTRAGANAISELALLKRPLIVIPGPHLTGGHQLQNAQRLAEQNTILIHQQSDLQKDSQPLATTIQTLLSHPDQAAAMGDKLYQLAAHPKAVEQLSEIIINHG